MTTGNVSTDVNNALQTILLQRMYYVCKNYVQNSLIGSNKFVLDFFASRLPQLFRKITAETTKVLFLLPPAT